MVREGNLLLCRNQGGGDEDLDSEGKSVESDDFLDGDFPSEVEETIDVVGCGDGSMAALFSTPIGGNRVSSYPKGGGGGGEFKR